MHQAVCLIKPHEIENDYEIYYERSLTCRVLLLILNKIWNYMNYTILKNCVISFSLVEKVQFQ